MDGFMNTAAKMAQERITNYAVTTGTNMVANVVPYSVYARFPPFKAVCVAYNSLLTEESKFKINKALQQNLKPDLYSKYQILTNLCKEEKTSPKEFIQENKTLLMPVLEAFNGKVDFTKSEEEIKVEVNKPQNIDALVLKIQTNSGEINEKFDKLTKQLSGKGGTRRKKKRKSRQRKSRR
jgi:hypothetical protein